jgi:translocation and assembly module TamB
VKQFNFDQIKAFVPEATELKGEANADVWAKWDGANSPEVKVSVELPSGQVTQKLDQPLQVGWEAIKLNAVLKQDRLDADWLIDVRDNGDISGKATIPNVLVDDKQIDGKLQLSTFTLDFLSPLLGEYNELKSSITTDLAFSGPVMQPKVDGQFVIDDMRLQGQISPVQVDSGRLTIDFSGYQAQLQAGLNTPDGTLKLTGDADWHNLEEWSTKLRVFASELKVEVPPMVDIKVVPDMTISATPKFAKIEGDIGLPWGRIVVEELPPSAIGISKDQVILNEQLQPEESMSSIPFAVETNINISIGDDFKLSAFGLEGGLKGNLNVAQRDKGPFITGEINIVDGSYQSFGQDLVIEQGKILMNGPVDQPYVQITAIRNPDNTQDDVTAGVKVTGPATEPIVTIFSDPAMPQANALSYLLRGQDIDGESGGNAMTTTLIGLSLAQSGRVVGEIGEAFGVQDLQLDTAGSGEDSQVTVSGYVLPGLQVKYGVGIFDSVGEFTVRYRLMTDLYVETVTGVSSAVDLLYQFEFN